MDLTKGDEPSQTSNAILAEYFKETSIEAKTKGDVKLAKQPSID